MFIKRCLRSSHVYHVKIPFNAFYHNEITKKNENILYWFIDPYPHMEWDKSHIRIVFIYHLKFFSYFCGVKSKISKYKVDCMTEFSMNRKIKVA